MNKQDPYKYIRLAGYTLDTALPCDTCRREASDCKKLILAGRDHVCAIKY